MLAIRLAPCVTGGREDGRLVGPKRCTDDLVIAAARNGWQGYPQAGERCFRPDKNLFGIAGLTAFNVACPPLAQSVADQRRWVAFTANHGWAAYPQAGAGCVDP